MSGPRRRHPIFQGLLPAPDPGRNPRTICLIPLFRSYSLLLVAQSTKIFY
ncbi:hypothetical protein ACRALDRAFT_2019756 [Sodiomyces alcalophilus JCM 7366]